MGELLETYNKLALLDKKHYILHIDESGGSFLNDTKDRHFFLTGLVVDAKEDTSLANYFNFIKRKHGIAEDSPFHSYELLEDQDSGNYLGKRRGNRLVESLAEFIKISPLAATVFSFDKKDFRHFINLKNNKYFSQKGADREIRRQDKDLGYEILAAKIFFWFAKFIQKKKGRGSIIVESRRESDYAVLRAFLACQDPNRFLKYPNLKRAAASFNEYVTAIKFENKKGLCRGLELADLISFVAFQAFHRRFAKFDKHGLVKLKAFWNVAKSRLESKKILSTNRSDFKKLVSSRRVNRISEFYNRPRSPVNPTRRRVST